MSSRRRILAALLGFLPVGGDTSANSTDYTPSVVWGGTPAAQAGTVTEISARFAGSVDTLRFFVIRNVGGTWTVQATTGNLTPTIGLASYAVSLAVQPGDLLGVYQRNGTPLLRYVASGTGTYYRSASTTSPAAAGTYSVSQTDTNHTYAFAGTGV